MSINKMVMITASETEVKIVFCRALESGITFCRKFTINGLAGKENNEAINRKINHIVYKFQDSAGHEEFVDQEAIIVGYLYTIPFANLVNDIAHIINASNKNKELVSAILDLIWFCRTIIVFHDHAGRIKEESQSKNDEHSLVYGHIMAKYTV